eukprot:1161308-Pelagomonas_calceolata.AAC.8
MPLYVRASECCTQTAGRPAAVLLLPAFYIALLRLLGERASRGRQMCIVSVKPQSITCPVANTANVPNARLTCWEYGEHENGQRL